jgi:hypothetical protein
MEVIILSGSLELVSSSRDLGATTGKIQIINDEKSINLQWDPSDCMLVRHE